MRSFIFIGLTLVALGILGLAYQGLAYAARETITDVGPVQLSADRERAVWIPPLLGGVAVLAGAALCAAGMRKPAKISA